VTGIFQDDLEQLQTFIATYPRLAILTGAGISLAAGIPTYRDKEGVWRHREPVKYQEFLKEPARRQRYWARSMRGWPAIRDAIPTDAHKALANLERRGHIDTLITQNVDGLHQAAGSEQVIDLHGRLDRVRCLSCERNQKREDVQRQLIEDNGEVQNTDEPRPDGDAELDPEIERRFVSPTCKHCDGILMPDLVFFGDTVPRERVQTAMKAVERADALITIGSSLKVFSGFRFCRRAHELGKPQVIMNPGLTRGDELSQLKLNSDCQALLKTIDNI